MIKDLQGIFESITPENIKNIPFIRDAINIFIETLEDLSKESIDIAQFYKNESIKEELIKIYINDLYNVFKAAEENQKLFDAIDRLNSSNDTLIDKNIIPNISQYLTEEHFLTFRAFKEKKGSIQAIVYIYEVLNSLFKNKLSGLRLKIEEGDPFELRMKGGLPREFYEFIISPLAHPLGFVYEYSNDLAVILEDYFGNAIFIYDVRYLFVRCVNPSTGEVNEVQFTKTLVDIASNEFAKEYIFEDGSKLVRKLDINRNVVVEYHENGVITTYEGQCDIYIDYDLNIEVEDLITEDIGYSDVKNIADLVEVQDPITEKHTYSVDDTIEIQTEKSDLYRYLATHNQTYKVFSISFQEFTVTDEQYPIAIESISGTDVGLVSGTFEEYSSFSITSGSFYEPKNGYSTDSIDVNFNISGGSFDEPKNGYSTDSIDVNFNISGGTHEST